MARKSTLGESTILRKSFGGCELASIFRVAFSFLNSMYYMLFAVGLETFARWCTGFPTWPIGNRNLVISAAYSH